METWLQNDMIYQGHLFSVVEGAAQLEDGSQEVWEMVEHLGGVAKEKNLMRPSIEQQVTFLYTRDLAKTAGFYENILDLPLVLDQGSCQIYQACDGAFLGFCQHLDALERPKGVILTLVSQEVDQWYDYLRQQGVAIEKAPALNAKFNIYHLFLRDPNGYLIEIQYFLDPAWPQP